MCLEIITSLKLSEAELLLQLLQFDYPLINFAHEAVCFMCEIQRVTRPQTEITASKLHNYLIIYK